VSAGVQCDTCRDFTPSPAAGWLHVVRLGEPAGVMAMLTGGSETSVTASFCSMLCLAQYAMARALVDGRAAGEEPL
jgi:hypothetical protein